MPDQPGIPNRGLAVLYRLPVDGIADHLDEGADARIFGDEAMVPAFLLRADQHQLEPALPDDAAAEALEHRAAVTAIGRIGLETARLAAVGIGRILAQAHEVEHVDRPGPVALPEFCEDLLGRIDMAHASLPAVPGTCSIMAAACPNR